MQVDGYKSAVVIPVIDSESRSVLAATVTPTQDAVVFVGSRAQLRPGEDRPVGARRWLLDSFRLKREHLGA